VFLAKRTTAPRDGAPCLGVAGGGAEFTQTHVMEVESVRSPVDAPVSLFAIPSNWREQAPIVGTPGL
jgi:hypothetical protein